MLGNALYAHSGGVTSVINASAYGVISSLLDFKQVKNIYCAKNGIIGVLNEELLDISGVNKQVLKKLQFIPASIFGSCRHKLDTSKNSEELKRIFQMFEKYNIRYFFYNGGGDSMDTVNKISDYAKNISYEIQAIGVPKTIDNDLYITDNCPGYGSVAKYIAISSLEAKMDLKSMAKTSTKVFIMEVMGRHTGWIAAASGLISQENDAHIILFPEKTFHESEFINKLTTCVNIHGYCVVVASEGIKDQNSNYISSSSTKDSFGHMQLGGVAPFLANLVKQTTGFKTHWCVPDYLQRSCGHLTSLTDVKQAINLGEKAVELAKSGLNNVFSIIKRISDDPYTWDTCYANVSDVANKEKKVPMDYISDDGFFITDKCRKYIQPLIHGEHYPEYYKGIPNYSLNLV